MHSFFGSNGEELGRGFGLDHLFVMGLGVVAVLVSCSLLGCYVFLELPFFHGDFKSVDLLLVG